MTQPDKLMSEALEKLLSVDHERGGSLQPDGQFYYRVPESVFKKAKEALQSNGPTDKDGIFPNGSSTCAHRAWVKIDSGTRRKCFHCGFVPPDNITKTS